MVLFESSFQGFAFLMRWTKVRFQLRDSRSHDTLQSINSSGKISPLLSQWYTAVAQALYYLTFIGELVLMWLILMLSAGIQSQITLLSLFSLWSSLCDSSSLTVLVPVLIPKEPFLPTQIGSPPKQNKAYRKRMIIHLHLFFFFFLAGGASCFLCSSRSVELQAEHSSSSSY